MSDPLMMSNIALLKYIIFGTFVIGVYAHATGMEDVAPCGANPQTQVSRSKELLDLYNADQSDRKDIEAHPDRSWPTEVFMAMGHKDLIRRKRVGEILGEGCINNSADFKAAAMIFQHGNNSEHFFQAFVWSKKSVDLGNVSQKNVVAKAIDRYLVSINHKQLFGTQAFKLDPSSGGCYCLQPIENTFTDALRIAYDERTKQKAFDWVSQTLNAGKSCKAVECETPLTDSPRGTVLGFW